MIIVDLPIPAGFEIEREDLDRFVSSGRIARYELTARSAILYLRSLAPDRPLELRYRLRAGHDARESPGPARRRLRVLRPGEEGDERAGTAYGRVRSIARRQET